MTEPRGLNFGSKPVVTPAPVAQTPAAPQVQPMAVGANYGAPALTPSLAPEQAFDMTSVMDFGRSEAMAQTNIVSKINQSMLANDLGEMGKSLNALVIGAQQYDPGKFKGGVFGFLKRSKRQLESHFSSVDKQVNTLAADVDKHAVRMTQRQKDIDALSIENQQRYDATKAKIAEGERRVAWMEANLPAVPDGDALAAQRLSAWNTTIAYAKKRLGDLRDGLLLGEMSAVELDQAKQDGAMLVMTLGEVRETTLPQLQMAFAKYIINMEQVQTAEFAKKVKDMNNAIIQANAKQLGAGTVLIREQMARGSVDIQTLQIVRDELFRTLDASKKIQEDMVTRVTTQRPLVEQMSRDLAAKLAATA